MKVNVGVYAKPGAKGDKVWCSYSVGGFEYSAFGAVGFTGVAAIRPSSINFQQVVGVSSGSVMGRVTKKERSGYRCVGAYQLCTLTKTATLLNTSKNTPVDDSEVPVPARARTKVPKLVSNVVWAW